MAEPIFAKDRDQFAEVLFNAQADQEGNLLGWADQGDLGKEHYRKICDETIKSLRKSGWQITPPAAARRNFHKLVRNLRKAVP